MRLRPWQKQFIRDLYAPHVDGIRSFRRAIISVARKNGKTAIIAAIALAHLIGPEAIKNGEIYSAANDREQAGQVFKFLRQLIDADEELSHVLDIVPSTKRVVCKQNGSFYRALSADAGTKHGLSPSVWSYEGLAQSRCQERYEVMNSPQGARAEQL